MPRNDRFRNLEQVRTERLRLSLISEQHADNLRDTWDLLRDPDFRRDLALDTVGDVLGAVRPLRAVGEFFHGQNGTADNIMARVGITGFKGRLIGTLLAAAAPLVWKEYMTPERLEKLEARMGGPLRWLRDLLHRDR